MTNPTIQRIAIDIDEVLADTVSRFLEWYERDYGIRITRDELFNKKLRQIVPEEHYETVRQYPHQKGFFADLPLIPNGRETVIKLAERYEIFIVTAAMQFRHSLDDKYVWLEKHFDFIHWDHQVFCGDKSIIRADCMIDDHDFNLKNFTGRRILFSAPHNQWVTDYERVNSWKEVADLLLI